MSTWHRENNGGSAADPDLEYDGGMDDMEPLIDKEQMEKKQESQEKSSCIEDEGIQVVFKKIPYEGQSKASNDEAIKNDQDLHQQYFNNGHKPPSQHKQTESGDFQRRTEVLSDNWLIIVKTIIVSLCTISSIIMNIITIMNDTNEDSVDGIDDKSHDWTTSINQYFAEDLSRRDALLIVNGLLIDLLVTIQGIRLIFRGTTFRFFFASITFYSVRALIQYLTVLQFPQGYNWGYPGFPSLFVQYGETPDFFPSGHTGHCFMEYLEYSALGWTFMSYFSLLVMFYTIFVLLITRVHYSIDIMGGLILAHLFWIFSDRYVYLFDHYLLGVPLAKRLGPDERTIEAIRIEEKLRKQAEESEETPGGKKADKDEEGDNIKSSKDTSVGGHQLKDAESREQFKKTNAYLRCRCCDQSVGQYLVYREHAVHAPNEPEDFQDFQYKIVQNQ